MVRRLSSPAFAWDTPFFSDLDPLIPRITALRPSLWAVVFALLEDCARSSQWIQSNPVHATVQEVISELILARTILEGNLAMYIGEIREFAIADPPVGWLRCDGAEYANVDYPLLAAVINPGFVVDVDHFRVPDRNRRLGMDGLDVAMHEGEETHILLVSEMPSHRHMVEQFGTAPSVVLGELAGFEIAPEADFTGFEGGGGAHNNIQPVEGTQFYIRADWPTVG